MCNKIEKALVQKGRGSLVAVRELYRADPACMGQGWQMIVSLTSYPARMGTLHLVLQSLYAQSMKPELIILWLARDQFPNRDADLPSSLIEDAKAGLVDVRWCENLGSHKKYFFVMQEYPDDVIVTVDDDVIYDPQALEALYESYKRHPHAISAHRVSLILFDAQGKLLPPSRWILPYVALKDSPSLQLMAVGSRGILYPPGIIGQGAFDEYKIKAHCTINGTVFLNDSWLKIHELIDGVPVVCVDGACASKQVPEAQEVALRWSAATEPLLWDAEFRLWQNVLCLENFKQFFSDINDDLSWEPIEEDAVLANVACKFRRLAERNGIDKDRAINIIRLSVRELNRQKALGVSDEKWKRSIYEYQCILQKASSLEELSIKTLSFHALVDYGFVLLDNLWGDRFAEQLQFDEMSASWKSFFELNPKCEAAYRKGYRLFLLNMSEFELASMGRRHSPLGKLLIKLRKKLLLCNNR